MGTAIPDHVDKADKVVAVSGDDPTQTVPVQEVRPTPSTVVDDAGLEGLGVELVELAVGARPAAIRSRRPWRMVSVGLSPRR